MPRSLRVGVPQRVSDACLGAGAQRLIAEVAYIGSQRQQKGSSLGPALRRSLAASASRAVLSAAASLAEMTGWLTECVLVAG